MNREQVTKDVDKVAESLFYHHARVQPTLPRADKGHSDDDDHDDSSSIGGRKDQVHPVTANGSPVAARRRGNNSNSTSTSTSSSKEDQPNSRTLTQLIMKRMQVQAAAEAMQTQYTRNMLAQLKRADTQVGAGDSGRGGGVGGAADEGSSPGWPPASVDIWTTSPTKARGDGGSAAVAALVEAFTNEDVSVSSAGTIACSDQVQL